MKKLLLIATGGTIASSELGEGLTPAIDAEEILSYIPEIKSVCELEGISIMSVDSTNMNPALMVKIAEAVKENYESYDAFVISHGTDTMAYSAAALSYMLRNLGKPVVMTGAQLSLEEAHTDARQNLKDAIYFACEDVNGVYLVFDGLVINGTHAMKMKTKSFDGFSSINFPEVATVKYGKVTYNQTLLYEKYWEKLGEDISGEFTAQTKLDQDILVLKIFPGISPKIFDFIKENYKGVIIESFGAGGIPTQDFDIVSKVGELVEAGIAVVITTQCLYEASDLSIYEVGQKLAKHNIIHAGDMTTEALVAKLMWALGQYNTLDEIKKCIETAYFFDRSC